MDLASTLLLLHGGGAAVNAVDAVVRMPEGNAVAICTKVPWNRSACFDPRHAWEVAGAATAVEIGTWWNGNTRMDCGCILWLEVIL